MAPLSILPGRLRLESPLLNGRRDLCPWLEKTIADLEGVRKVSANHRTGRLLVQFDETQIDREVLAGRIQELLASGDRDPAAASGDANRPAGAGPAAPGAPGHLTRHLLLDLAAHALLPKPLDLLLSPAMAVVRR